MCRIAITPRRRSLAGRAQRTGQGIVKVLGRVEVRAIAKASVAKAQVIARVPVPVGKVEETLARKAAAQVRRARAPDKRVLAPARRAAGRARARVPVARVAAATKRRPKAAEIARPTVHRPA